MIQGVEVLGGPPIRSIISKVVAPQDQGEKMNHYNYTAHDKEVSIVVYSMVTVLYIRVIITHSL